MASVLYFDGSFSVFSLDFPVEVRPQKGANVNNLHIHIVAGGAVTLNNPQIAANATIHVPADSAITFNAITGSFEVKAANSHAVLAILPVVGSNQSPAISAGGGKATQVKINAQGKVDATTLPPNSQQGNDTPVPIDISEPSPTLLAQAQQRSAENLKLTALATTKTPYLDTLLSGKYWDKGMQAITYGFNDAMPVEYSDPQAGIARANWKTLNPTEKQVVRATFAELNALLGVQFQEVAGNNADIRWNALDMNEGLAGFAFYPDGTSVGGDVFLSTGYRDAEGAAYYARDGGFGAHTITHELGHALGLSHPFAEDDSPGKPVLPKALDNLAHTLMTYEEAGVHHAVFNWSNGRLEWQSEGVYPSSLAVLDVQALQAVYGANTKTRTGNDTYKVDSSKLQQLTIWDAGGTDTIDASANVGRSIVDLRDGASSSIGLLSLDEMVRIETQKLVAQGAGADFALQKVREVLQLMDREGTLYDGSDNLALVKGVVIENVRTGSGDDVVYDNAVNNRIETGAGNDTIYLGAGGFDWVDAGTGMDTVVFKEVRQSAVQHGKQQDGSWLVVHDSFAVQLLGVEQLQFADGQVTLA